MTVGLRLLLQTLSILFELAELIIGLWNDGVERDLRDAFLQAEMLIRLAKKVIKIVS